MSREARFLRLPVPYKDSNKGWTFVQIDPARLNIQQIIELYYNEDGRYRSSGEDCVVRREVDPALLVDVLREQLDQIKVLIGHQVEAEDSDKISSAVVVPLAELASVFTALASGQVSLAADQLTTVMSTLMADLSGLAAHIATLRKVSDGMVASAEHFEEKAADLEREKRDARIAELREWALAAEAVFGTVSELKTIEAKLVPLVEQFERERFDALELFREDSPRLLDAVKFLDLDFTGKAIVFVAHPDTMQATEMLELAINAGNTIDEWRQAEEAQRKAREAQRGMFDREIEPLSEQILALCQRLSQERKALREFPAKLAVTPEQLPCDIIVRGEPLISRERYDAACSFVNDVAWYPDTVRQRLQALVSRIGHLIRQPPKLPDAADAVFTTAKSYLNSVNDILDTMTSATTAEEDDHEEAAAAVVACATKVAIASADVRKATGQAPSPPLDAIPPSSADIRAEAVSSGAEAASATDTNAVAPQDGALTGERLDTLMELLLAVGYARTCNPNPWSSSSIKAMLRLLPRLGLATYDEVDACIDPILTVIEAVPVGGEIPRLETVGKSAKIADRWNESRSDWVRFMRGGTAYRYKLTKRMEAKGAAMLSKHGLSVDVIKRLDETRREEEKQAYRERKEAEAAGGGSS